jgi:hypothetical protein
MTELPDDEVDDSPWADGPLIGNASGDFIYYATRRRNERLPASPVAEADGVAHEGKMGNRASRNRAPALEVCGAG